MLLFSWYGGYAGKKKFLPLILDVSGDYFK